MIDAAELVVKLAISWKIVPWDESEYSIGICV